MPFEYVKLVRSNLKNPPNTTPSSAVAIAASSPDNFTQTSLLSCSSAVQFEFTDEPQLVEFNCCLFNFNAIIHL